MTRGEGTAHVTDRDAGTAAADGAEPVSVTPPDKCVHGHEYTHFQELAHNLPYVVMTLVGAALFYFSSLDSSWAWASATGYFAYAFLATLSFIVLLCPYCRYYDTRQCPCGYGQIAAKLRSRKEAANFGKRFLGQVLVILPLWIAPPVVAGIALYSSFDWFITALLAVFAVDSFVLLPLVAAKYGCANCPQKEDCPWMGCRGARS